MHSRARTAFTTACRNAKLGAVLRCRSCGISLAAESQGIDLITIQELGRWKDIKRVERYAYRFPSHKAAAMDWIDVPSNVTGFATPEGPTAVNH